MNFHNRIRKIFELFLVDSDRNRESPTGSPQK